MGTRMQELHPAGDNVAHLVPNKPDAEVAADFKNRLIEVYEPMLRLLDEITAAGFECGITATLGPLGKHVIGALKIVKIY